MMEYKIKMKQTLTAEGHVLLAVSNHLVLIQIETFTRLAIEMNQHDLKLLIFYSADCRTANFGSNWGQNSKTIEFPGKFKCPKNVDKSNWIGEHSDRDQFSITQTDTSVTVRRTDGGTNWGMQLKFWCCKGTIRFQ